MMLLLVSFLILPWSSTGSYADDLGLECSGYSYEKPELKKTKVWKKCHDSNKKLKECLEKGLAPKDVGALVDKDEILCNYIHSREHVIYYTDQVDAEEAGILKKYQKGKEFKAYVEELKSAFIKLAAADISVDIISKLKEEYEQKMVDARVQSIFDLIVKFEGMAELTSAYSEEIEAKASNVLLNYEDMALHQGVDLPLHMEEAPLDIDPTTYPRWAKPLMSMSLESWGTGLPEPPTEPPTLPTDPLPSLMHSDGGIFYNPWGMPDMGPMNYAYDG